MGEDPVKVAADLAEAWRALQAEPFTAPLPTTLETLLMTMLQLDAEIRALRDEVKWLRSFVQGGGR